MDTAPTGTGSVATTLTRIALADSGAAAALTVGAAVTTPVFRTMPDAELIACTYLRGLPGLGLAGVSTALPPAPIFPWVTVTQIGGTMAEDRFLSTPRLQVDVWSDDRQQASETCRAVHAALLGIPWDVPNGAISHVGTVTVPQWFPDPLTNPPLARFLLVVAVTIRPTS